MKDSVRRQIEESHVQLKSTFTEFTSQIDSFHAQVASSQAESEVLRGEIRGAFAKMDFTQRSIDLMQAQIEDIQQSTVTVTAFSEWKRVSDKENHVRQEAINKLEK